MTPKFYSFLWIVFAVSAGIIWLAGVFTLTTVVVYGFISFGLVFTGMMCVLPGAVSHPPVKRERVAKAPKQGRVSTGSRATMPTAIGLRTH